MALRRLSTLAEASRASRATRRLSKRRNQQPPPLQFHPTNEIRLARLHFRPRLRRLGSPFAVIACHWPSRHSLKMHGASAGGRNPARVFRRRDSLIGPAPSRPGSFLQPETQTFLAVILHLGLVAQAAQFRVQSEYLLARFLIGWEEDGQSQRDFAAVGFAKLNDHL